MDKARYEGDFIDNEFEGNGVYYLDNGNYYEGQFKKGKFNGYGKEYDKDGKILREGKYINGNLDGDCIIF